MMVFRQKRMVKYSLRQLLSIDILLTIRVYQYLLLHDVSSHLISDVNVCLNLYSLSLQYVYLHCGCDAAVDFTTSELVCISLKEEQKAWE